ncbi:MAG: sigma-70 family RNA polymerase sigma factor [Chitinophagaceae bacterium]|jgi:RNA polymerase sigma-70 factor (ECF subfamily)|nr:sigma-70 family RNA polymerase sigma factor [Chitinophagaceae bacterium]
MSLSPDNWVKQYGDLLYAYTRARVDDTAAAEDIVQETFLSAWKARDGFKGEASEKSWLFTICKHKIIDYYRKQSREATSPLPDHDHTDVFFDNKEHWTRKDQPVNWGIEEAAPINQKEFYAVLEACKNKLQQMQQAVFVMKYLEELDAATICKELGITPSNYWVLIHRAKLQLRACLEKNWINLK